MIILEKKFYKGGEMNRGRTGKWAKRLRGEPESGRNDPGAKRLGAKGKVGETTQGRTGKWAKRPGFHIFEHSNAGSTDPDIHKPTYICPDLPIPYHTLPQPHLLSTLLHPTPYHPPYSTLPLKIKLYNLMDYFPGIQIFQGTQRSAGC